MTEPARPTPSADDYPPQSAFSVGLSGRCPRCGQGRLFDGFLTTAPRCRACGLDYDFADSGDGPAVFIMMFVGFLIVGAALVVELKFEPPIWVHMIVWLPLTAIVALALLRPMKGLMIALQYVNKAREGRIEP
ncbi:DUF983 domain-containing protein [Pseudoxanthobacter sp. M-2]|uniref:DUF983 domain-containing protein n=1 Tax=Pseudoxanthobacter sp. M-2 TaxID=3078754 RepID=UPI0038FC92A4